MSEIAFQQALVRLLTDPQLRESFFAGESQILADTGVAAEEIGRLSKIDPERLGLFADMIMGQRLKDTSDGLPFTARLLGDDLFNLGMEFYASTRAEYDKRRDAPLTFARFLAKKFEANTPKPLYLQDVLAFEIISLELLDEAENEYADLEIQPISDQNILLRQVPVLMPRVRLASFNTDVPSIIKSLKADQVPPALEPNATDLMLQVGSSGSIQQSRVNAATVAFLRACDGTTTLNEIVEHLFKEFRQDPSTYSFFKEKCVNLCVSLLERRVIRFRKPSLDSEAS